MYSWSLFIVVDLHFNVFHLRARALQQRMANGGGDMCLKWHKRRLSHTYHTYGLVFAASHFWSSHHPARPPAAHRELNESS